jgi:signal transduction histidine kinase
MSLIVTWLRRSFTYSKRHKTIIFSIFGCCILIISIIFFALSAVTPYMGIELSFSNKDWIVKVVDPTGLAYAAGIKENDKPIKINDEPAQLFLEKYEKEGFVFGRLIKELTVIDDHGNLKSVALRSGSPSSTFLTKLGASFIVCLVFWITGLYVYFKRQKNIAALLLYLFTLSFGLIPSANMAAEIAIPTAVFFEVGASIIGPWLLLHFFLILPEERAWLRNNLLIYLIYLPSAITLILFPLVGYANGQPIMWFRTVRMFEYGVGFLAVASTAIFNFIRAKSPKTKQQMKIVFISCFAALIPFLFLGLIPSVTLARPIISSDYSILLIVFIPIGLVYAIVTEKLMDIDVIIRRSVVYGLIIAVMSAILGAGISTALAFRNSITATREIVIALALGGTATALFGPTKSGVESLVDKLFYKDRYDYKKIIQSLSASLNSVKDLNGVSRLIVGTTVNTLNLAGGCLFTKAQFDSYEISAVQGSFVDANKQRQLLNLISQRSYLNEFPNMVSKGSADLAFFIPLIEVGKEVGILCLSQKATKQDFSSNDIFLIQGIASVAAIALHGAMLIRDVSIRDTFVSVASHELRTPLTSIMGYADLLLSRDPSDITRKKWIKNIFNNSQKLNVIVDDLLNVSRIQSGRINIRLESVKLSDLVEEMLCLSHGDTDKHEFVVDIEPDLPDIWVDRDKFCQIVGNLLSNAIKYSPNGGRITLSARSEPTENRVIVSVTDQGLGICPEDQSSLFVTFHRIQRPETQRIRGSGLGLYIAKELTEAMGGKIWFESKLNKGSTFYVAVPTQKSPKSDLK